MFGRRRIAALVAEFLGTGVLTLIFLSMQRSQIGVPFFIGAGAGLAIIAMTFVFAGTSGAHFNPAVTLGLWTARRIATLRAVLYIAFQLLGAYSAYLLYTYFVDNKLQDIGGEFSGRTLVAETVGAALLSFGIAAAIFQRFSIGLRAAVVGISYMLAIVAASSASLGLINPALAFGVQAWVWGTYILGPILGAVIGVNLYALLFADQTTRAVTTDVNDDVTAAEAAPRTTVTSAPRVAAVKKPRATTTRAKATTAKSRTTTKRATAKTTKTTSARRKKA